MYLGHLLYKTGILVDISGIHIPLLPWKGSNFVSSENEAI